MRSKTKQALRASAYKAVTLAPALCTYASSELCKCGSAAGILKREALRFEVLLLLVLVLLLQVQTLTSW